MPRMGIAQRIAAVHEALDAAPVLWMTGAELGSVPDVEDQISLWLYKHKTAEELADTLTHEAVHLSDMDLSEGAVNTVTAALMARPDWRVIAFARVAQELFDALHGLKKRNRIEVA